jgi:glycosyltransferase involved in cell wall biosynthesis
VFRLADRVLPFSDYAYAETLQNTPTPAHKVMRVHLGVPDVDLFSQKIPKENSVFTVSTIDRVSVIRKGLHKFVQTAALLPDVPFIMVGKARDDAIDDLKRIATPNVQFTGYLSDDELNTLRHKAKIYVQASEHEGFGLAMAEAMLARCVVIATRVGSLPEVMGDAGIFLADDAPQTIATAIQSALATDDGLGELARKRILTQFPLQNRAQALYDTIDQMTRSAR